MTMNHPVKFKDLREFAERRVAYPEPELLGLVQSDAAAQSTLVELVSNSDLTSESVDNRMNSLVDGFRRRHELYEFYEARPAIMVSECLAREASETAAAALDFMLVQEPHIVAGINGIKRVLYGES
jgi:hypothetical protein